MSAGRPTLFISHSSSEDELARRVIERLCERVHGTLDVLLDEEVLEGGQRWRNELWNWWSDCDVAVIVCSDSALQSRWVMLEVSVLMRRKSINTGFPILPLLVHPATADRVKTSLFHDQNLQEIQFTSITDASFDAVTDELAAKLALFRALGRSGKPLLQWEDRLAAVLESVDSPSLLKAAQKLGTYAETWAGIPVQARIVSRALLETCERTKTLDALSALSPRLGDHLCEVVDLVAPSWLQPNEIGPVAGIIDRPAGSRGVCLGTWVKRMASWHVQRATGRYPLARPIEFKMPRGSDDVTETVESIAASVREHLHLDEDMPDEVAKRRLARKEEEREPVFVLVPVDAKPQKSRLEAALLVEVMKDVNAKFPTLGFFVLSGTERASLAEAESSGRVVFLPHDSVRELDLSTDYTAAIG
jgi:hypothetical protein